MSTYDETLDGFAKLEKDWDSYGADPIDPEVVEAVRVFLGAIRRGDASVVPTRMGGVQVEFHGGGFDVEVEFDGRPELVGDVEGFWERRA